MYILKYMLLYCFLDAYESVSEGSICRLRLQTSKLGVSVDQMRLLLITCIILLPAIINN